MPGLFLAPSDASSGGLSYVIEKMRGGKQTNRAKPNSGSNPLVSSIQMALLPRLFWYNPLSYWWGKIQTNKIKKADSSQSCLQPIDHPKSHIAVSQGGIQFVEVVRGPNGKSKMFCLRYSITSNDYGLE